MTVSFFRFNTLFIFHKSFTETLSASTYKFEWSQNLPQDGTGSSSTDQESTLNDLSIGSVVPDWPLDGQLEG